MKVIILMLTAAVAACSSNTGIIKIDRDTYYVAKRSPQVSFGPPVEQIRDVYTEANDFCLATGKSVETVSLDQANQIFGRHGSASLKFRCADFTK